MSATTARPLRALAAVLAVYAGARVVTVNYDVLPRRDAGVGPNVGAVLAQRAAGLATVPARAAPGRASPGEPAWGPIGVSGLAAAAMLPWQPALATIRRRGTVLVAQDVPTARPRIAAAAPAADRSWQASATPASELSPSVAQAAAPAFAPGIPLRRPAGPRKTLSGSVWALGREGSGDRDLAGAGTLGGSQAGVRVNLDTGVHGLFATARASAALARRDREVAVGVGWRGRHVGVIVEQRFSLEKRRTDEAAVLGYGGIGDVPLAAGLRLDAYAQAGIVGLSRRAAFADGAVRIERTVAERGRWRWSAGAGVWGGAQPGVARLDIGPQLVARIPLGGVNARIAADYRFRIAGRARPATGLAVSLGADF